MPIVRHIAQGHGLDKSTHACAEKRERTSAVLATGTLRPNLVNPVSASACTQKRGGVSAVCVGGAGERESLDPDSVCLCSKAGVCAGSAGCGHMSHRHFH